MLLLLLLPVSAWAGINPPTNFRTDASDFSDLDLPIGAIQAQLRWTDNADNETAYQVDVSTNGSTWFLSRTLAANAQGDDTEIIPWTSNRWYRVRAVNATEQSSYAGPIQIFGYMPPSRLGGSTADTTHMTVTWDTAGGYIDGYTVQRATNAAFTQDLVSYYLQALPDPNIKSTNYTINFSFVANVIYYFRVASTNSAIAAPNGNSEFQDKPISYIACAPNGPPTSPSFVSMHMDGTAAEAVILFDDASLNETGWQLQYSTNGGSTYFTVGVPYTGDTRYTVVTSGLTGGMPYAWRLAATNAVGSSAYTTWSFTPPVDTSGFHVYYVDKSASGNSTGTNWANAWTSLGGIDWPELLPGDVVYIAGGDYTNYLVTFKDGAYGNPIIIKTATNAPHNGAANVYGQVAWKSDYVTIDGALSGAFVLGAVPQITNNINLFEIGKGTADSGAYLYHGVGNRIFWCDVTGTGSPSSGEGEAAGIQYGDFSGPTNCEIAYCYIHDVFGNAILGNVHADTGLGLGNIKIHHNLFERWHNNMMGGLGSSDVYNNWSETGWHGPGVAHPDGIEGGPTYTRIWGNHFFNISPPSGNALNIGVSEDNQVYHDFAYVNNVLGQDTGAMACLIGHQGTPEGLTLSNMVVAGNTFCSGDDAVTFSIVAGSATNWTGKKMVFANNIVNTGTNAGGAATFGSGRLRFASQADFVVDYNVLGGTAKIVSYRTNNATPVDVFDFATAEAFNAWSTLYKSNSSAPPYFAAKTSHDLSVYGYSTNTIDKGTNLSSFATLIPAITNDINGAGRGLGSAWDIGAYEWDPSWIMWLDFEGFTNGPGSIAFDRTGNGNHGLTLTNRTETDVGRTNYCPDVIPGRVGATAVNFRLLGSNEQWQVYHLNLGYEMGNWFGVTNWNKIDRITNGTFMCWYSETNTLGPGDFTIWSGGWLNSPEDDNTWDDSRYNYDNMTFTTYSNGVRRAALSVPNLGTNVWIHIARTWNATNNLLCLYTNGVLAQTNTMLAPYFKLADEAHNVIIGASTHGGSWTIGTGSRPITPDDEFPNNGWASGYLDELRIANRDLSASEIYSIYSGGGAAAPGGGGGNPGGGGGSSATGVLTYGGKVVKAVSGL